MKIVIPEKGIVAVIGWCGHTEKRYTIVELNTDGMIHMTHLKDEIGEVIKSSDGKLIEILYTREELAEKLNDNKYNWFPLSMFQNNGNRLKYDKRGNIRKDMIGLKDLEELK